MTIIFNKHTIGAIMARQSYQSVIIMPFNKFSTNIYRLYTCTIILEIVRKIELRFTL